MRYFYGANHFLNKDTMPLSFQKYHMSFQAVYGYIYEFNRMLSDQECKRLKLAFLLSLNDDEEDEDD